MCLSRRVQQARPLDTHCSAKWYLCLDFHTFFMCVLDWGCAAPMFTSIIYRPNWWPALSNNINNICFICGDVVLQKPIPEAGTNLVRAVFYPYLMRWFTISDKVLFIELFRITDVNNPYTVQESHGMLASHANSGIPFLEILTNRPFM